MKRFEIIFGIVFLIALVLKFTLIPGGGILATVSLMPLAIFYCFLSFAYFNNIKLKNIFSTKSYRGISTLRITGSIGTGLGLSAICMGILFKIQHWPGGDFFSTVGLIAVIIVAIIAFIKFLRSKNDFYKKVLLRIAIIGSLWLLLLFAADLGLAAAKIHYPNHPDYILVLKK